MKLYITENIEKIETGDKVVLADKYNGSWVRISKEVFDILDNISKKQVNIEELDNYFEEEDYFFIIETIDRLINCNILSFNSEVINIGNSMASVELTHRCNLKCIHCCIDAEKTNDIAMDLTTENIKKIFDKLIKWNPRQIMLSGGEPMLRKDFLELVLYLRNNYDGNITLSTNGTFINEENVEILSKNVNQFEISIDGIDEETCAKVRGKGIFNRVLKSINLLKKYNVNKINLSMVFSEKNEHLRDKFIELNKDLSTNPICRIFSPVGRGKESSELFLDKELYIPEEYLSVNYDNDFGISTCSAGRREIFIDYKGDVYPCPSYMEEKYLMGNIFYVKEIDELIKNKEIAGSIENIIRENDPKNSKMCKECSVKLFCWTCPAAIEDIPNESALRKYCDLMKPVLEKRIWEG